MPRAPTQTKVPSSLPPDRPGGSEGRSGQALSLLSPFRDRLLGTIWARPPSGAAGCLGRSADSQPHPSHALRQRWLRTTPLCRLSTLWPLLTRSVLFLSRPADWDECADSLGHDCSPAAQCVNLEGSYTCRCRTARDANPSRAGRACEGAPPPPSSGPRPSPGDLIPLVLSNLRWPPSRILPLFTSPQASG